MKSIIGIAELAEIMGVQPGTIRVYMSAHPARIPPWFKTEGARTPRWNRDVVEAYLRLCAEKHGATLEQYKKTVR